MNDSKILNPDGCLDPILASQMFMARKTKSLWAKKIEIAQDVVTLEGKETASVGDYLCRGIHGEYWPQKSSKLLDRYSGSSEIDAEGWTRFDPKPEQSPVEALQIAHPFRVKAIWGELTGKENDYVVRSVADRSDIWIVDRAIFEASYEKVL